ncbi:MAG: aldose 1-epimerase family protein [Bacteriovorax sp.]|nr:aldose 1-epimerase family protein [Bacteriovorax sp.]
MSDWYQIENIFFVVQVSTAGAEMKRLFAKTWQRELLWVARDESAKKVWNRSAPVLFPIVGKLKDDQYAFKGKKYTMPQHGFARDKNFKCVECSDHELTFELLADQETFKYYPFCFELRVRYAILDHHLTITYSVKNVDRQDIYFSIGSHPAFMTPHLEDYEIRFEKKERGYFHLKDKMVDWKNLTAMHSEVLTPTKVLFARDALIFKDVKSEYVDLVNIPRNETIRLHGSHTPYFGVWAKDSIPFICLEPWYGVSDDALHDQNIESKEGIQTLAMGAEFKFSYSIELT